MEPGAARAARGTAERSTQGTDHCHQMLLLSLLPRILRRGGGEGGRKKGSDLPFSGCFFFSFSPFFFPPSSFLSYHVSLAYAQRCTFVCGMRQLERRQR